ncbi:MAG: hypothetical protein EYC70_01505 [Planctomycetota bacterium]|nr:MAG: hypothetical protein EYC70_01505 [Planctomycetota bacterium]
MSSIVQAGRPLLAGMGMLLLLPAALGALNGAQDPAQRPQEPGRRGDHVMDVVSSFKIEHNEIRRQITQRLQNVAQDKGVAIHTEQVSITSLDNDTLVVGAPAGGAGAAKPKEGNTGTPNPADPTPGRQEPGRQDPGRDNPNPGGQDPNQPGRGQGGQGERDRQAQGQTGNQSAKDVIGIMVVVEEMGAATGANRGGQAGATGPGVGGPVQSGVYMVREGPQGGGVQLVDENGQVAATIALDPNRRMGARGDGRGDDGRGGGRSGQGEPAERPQQPPAGQEPGRNAPATQAQGARDGDGKLDTDASHWQAVYVAILDHLAPG